MICVGHEAVVEKLVQSGAFVNEQDEEGMFYGVTSFWFHIINFIFTFPGQTPLHYAATKGLFF